MPRSKEQNEKIRNTTKEGILDAALSQYVMFGYNGTDMDMVAKEAGVAKGLLYYYFKTKNILFRELFNKVLSKTMEFGGVIMQNLKGFNPVEKLIRYSIDIFGKGFKDPRYIQFAMRMPFDAYAVFGPDEWQKGLESSNKHCENLEKIITEGISLGYLKCNKAKDGANSFWTVYVAALFNFSKMTAGRENNLVAAVEYESLEQILAFGMSGLGVEEDLWKKTLKKFIEKDMKNESI